jgi:hypothetical protein
MDIVKELHTQKENRRESEEEEFVWKEEREKKLKTVEKCIQGKMRTVENSTGFEHGKRRRKQSYPPASCHGIAASAK